MVTDEMLEAAAKAAHKANAAFMATGRHRGTDDRWSDIARAALEAALAAMPQPVAWRWRWTDNDEWRLANSDPTEVMEKIASVVVQPLFTTPAQAQPSEEDDLRAAREAAAKAYENVGGSEFIIRSIRAGKNDRMGTVQSALIALRTERQRGKA